MFSLFHQRFGLSDVDYQITEAHPQLLNHLEHLEHLDMFQWHYIFVEIIFSLNNWETDST